METNHLLPVLTTFELDTAEAVVGATYVIFVIVGEFASNVVVAIAFEGSLAAAVKPALRQKLW